MDKILIIEDYLNDYISIAEVLDKYECQYFPPRHLARDFSDLLSSWADQPNDNDLEEIRSIVAKEAPNLILLDIGLSSANLLDDDTGLQLKAELLDKDFPQISVYKITGRFLQTNVTKSISKKSELGLENELYKKFLLENKIAKRKIAKSWEDNDIADDALPVQPNQKQENEFESNASSQIHSDKDGSNINGPTKQSETEGDRRVRKQQSNPLVSLLEPSPLTFLKKIYYFNLKPILVFGVDIVITLVFFFLMAYLAYLGGSTIYHSFEEKRKEMLVVAETAFVAFLPMMVVFGFYVLYKKSLRPYLLEIEGRVEDPDLDTTSKLVIFTKKLFVSSLISYLFTKMIEILFLDLDHSEPVPVNKFEIYHFTNHPLIQLYATAGAILLLGIFYWYLNFSHPNVHKPALHASEIKNE